MSTPCFSCGTQLSVSDFGRQDSCDQCRADTRVCKNCINFDTAFNNYCRENQAPRIVEKEKSNFCDWFKPGGDQAGTYDSDNLKSAAESLFKK